MHGFIIQEILQANCVSPIEGQYVTVQKYANKAGEDNINEIMELDVEVYCGPFINTNGNRTVCVIDEPDDPCQRKTWAEGKSEAHSEALQGS